MFKINKINKNVKFYILILKIGILKIVFKCKIFSIFWI